MDADDDQEVKDALEYLDPPPMPSRARDQWASGCNRHCLNFLGKQTVCAITTHQIHLATPRPSRRGWLLGGVDLHTVELTY
jgi:hypothetical protein